MAARGPAATSLAPAGARLHARRVGDLRRDRSAGTGHSRSPADDRPAPAVAIPARRIRAGVAGRGLAARHRLSPVTAAAAPHPIAAGHPPAERATRPAAADLSLGVRPLPRE